MDQDMCYIVYKGLERLAVPIISLHDVGLSRGIAVFELLRTYDGVPFHLDDHLIRLKESADYAHLPIQISLEEIKQVILKIIDECSQKNIAIKTIVTGGPNVCAMDPTEICVYNLAIPIQEKYFAQQKGGIEVDFIDYYRPYAVCKTMFYFPAFLERQKLMKNNRIVDDVLYTTPQGDVTEASTANIFMIQGKKLITPKDDVLFGITRKVVMQLATEIGLDAEEKNIKKEMLLNADEAFVCSTTREIIPLKRVYTRLFDLTLSKYTRMLQNSFRVYVEEYKKKHL